MPYDPEIHHRRSIRLRGYDYSQPGAYFVTICTEGKEHLFGQVVEGEMHRNERGDTVTRCWKWLEQRYPHVVRDEDELNKIREYIRTNPLQWATDAGFM